MVKSLIQRFLIWAIEGVNNLIGYFEHDIKRGSSRKTMAVSIVLVAVIGMSFLGTAITGQITKSRASATELSEKLGTAEAMYQDLSVKNEMLRTDYTGCASARDQFSSQLSTCRTDLSQKATDYETCSKSLESNKSRAGNLSNDYSRCASDLDSNKSKVASLTADLSALQVTHDSLTAKNGDIIRNAVIKWCCNQNPNRPLTIAYQLDASNRINCFVDSSVKTGDVSCP